MLPTRKGGAAIIGIVTTMLVQALGWVGIEVTPEAQLEITNFLLAAVALVVYFVKENPDHPAIGS